MKTLSIINLKGGVAKTVSAIAMAYILAVFHNKKILLVDNDKQGNTSKTFDVHSYEQKSIADILTERRINAHEVIRQTCYENIDVLPANMTLIKANLQVMMDSTRPQQTRLHTALAAVSGDYDYCIIDNAPDINIATINALVASNEVIIPIKIDEYAFDGLSELIEQIENTRDDLNPSLRLAGCLVTCFQRTDADKQGEAWLKNQSAYHVFDTHIRYSEKVTESTFARSPIPKYSRKSGAAIDYVAFVQEFLDTQKLSDSDTRE
ncbi:MAG: AAA family ATPase [Evtepia sp.]